MVMTFDRESFVERAKCYYTDMHRIQLIFSARYIVYLLTIAAHILTLIRTDSVSYVNGLTINVKALLIIGICVFVLWVEFKVFDSLFTFNSTVKNVKLEIDLDDLEYFREFEKRHPLSDLETCDMAEWLEKVPNSHLYFPTVRFYRVYKTHTGESTAHYVWSAASNWVVSSPAARGRITADCDDSLTDDEIVRCVLQPEHIGVERM